MQVGVCPSGFNRRTGRSCGAWLTLPRVGQQASGGGRLRCV